MKQTSPPERSKWQKPILAAIVAVTLCVAGISVWTNLSRERAQVAAIQSAAAQGIDQIEIITGTGRHKFFVEVMRTDAERAKGLMFRQSMPADRGMLFDFAADMPVSMWMKNTYIPLDMVFIRADGGIQRIERSTEPHSERTISSGEAVRAVLELNAGASDKIGLRPGDKVLHSMFPAK